MMKASIRLKSHSTILAFSIAFALENAMAVEIEPMGKALVSILKSSKVEMKPVPGSKSKAELYYVKGKGKKGKVSQVAFIERGVYAPNCTHTWAIGIQPKTGKVTEVRVIEMSCPHAFPTKAASFLDQFKGKGPADAPKLSKQVTTVTKATGSSKLATEAVQRSIVNWTKLYKSL